MSISSSPFVRLPSEEEKVKRLKGVLNQGDKIYVLMDHNWGPTSQQLIKKILQQHNFLTDLWFYDLVDENRNVPRKRPLPLHFTKDAPHQREKVSSFIYLWWSGITPHQHFFLDLRPHQKINVIPNMQGVFSKDMLTESMQLFSKKFGENAVPFYPKSFRLPMELEEWKQYWLKIDKKPFIMKPTCAARGRGIRLMTDFDDLDLQDDFIQNKRVVAQEYILNPLLINGYKITWRIFVVITCINPLRVYIHKKGLTSLSSKKFSASKDSFEDPLIHLTNADLHESFRSDFEESFFPSIIHEGLRCDMTDLLRYMKEDLGCNVDKLWLGIEETMLETAETWLCKPDQAFMVFGYDFLVDDTFKPWLLEINMSPQLQPIPLDPRATESKLEMLTDLFNLIDLDCSFEKQNLEQLEVLLQKMNDELPFESDFSWMQAPQPVFDRSYLSEYDYYSMIATLNEQSRRNGWDVVFPDPVTVSLFIPFLSSHSRSKLIALWMSQSDFPFL